MMKKEKTLRIALSCALLLAVAAAGVTMYRSENSVKKQDENQAEEQQMAEVPGAGGCHEQRRQRYGGCDL